MNENNLIPLNKRTKSEQREICSKGGKKSGNARRRKRDMKQKMQMILELPCSEQSDWNEASSMGIDIPEIDNETAMLIGLFKEAKSGNVQAVREVRNILGKDNSTEELALKKKEMKMKEEQISGDTGENAIVNAWLEALLGGDENGPGE